MQRYKQVPEWWFLILLFGSIALSLLMSFVWKDTVQLPWWGMLFAFAMAWIVTLPIGVIQATTNQVIGRVLVVVVLTCLSLGSLDHILKQSIWNLICSNLDMIL